MFYNQFSNKIQDLAILLSQTKSDNAEFCLLFKEEKQQTPWCTNLEKASSSDEVYFQPNLKNVLAPNSNSSGMYFEIHSCGATEVVGFFYCPVLLLLINP